VIHLLEKLFRVVAGVKDAMILADEFILGILTDGAEFVVKETLIKFSLSTGNIE